MVMVLLVSNHIVTFKANPGVHTLNIGAVGKGLLTGFWVSVKTSKLVEVLSVENTLLLVFSLSFFLKEIMVKLLFLSLIEFHLVLSILNFSLVLFNFSNGHLFLILVLWNLNIGISHDPGVWSINHSSIWERGSTIWVLQKACKLVHLSERRDLLKWVWNSIWGINSRWEVINWPVFGQATL
jgi:hypothetical protein